LRFEWPAPRMVAEPWWMRTEPGVRVGVGVGRSERVAVAVGPAVVSNKRRFVFDGNGDGERRGKGEGVEGGVGSVVRKDEVVVAPAFVILNE